MAIKGLTELLEKWKKDEIKDVSAFEAELTKGGLYEGYIPKDKFDEKNGEAKKLKEQLEAQNKLVDELKEKGNLSDDYKNQIDQLKASLDQKDKDYKAEIAGMRKTSAIEKALATAKAKESKAVMPYLDMAKILVSDDGSVTGLKEQLETVKKDHAFLFEEENPNPDNTHGGKPNPMWGGGSFEGGNNTTLKDAMFAAAGIKVGK